MSQKIVTEGLANTVSDVADYLKEVAHQLTIRTDGVSEDTLTADEQAVFDVMTRIISIGNNFGKLAAALHVPLEQERVAAVA